MNTWFWFAKTEGPNQTLLLKWTCVFAAPCEVPTAPFHFMNICLQVTSGWQRLHFAKNEPHPKPKIRVQLAAIIQNIKPTQFLAHHIVFPKIAQSTQQTKRGHKRPRRQGLTVAADLPVVHVRPLLKGIAGQAATVLDPWTKFGRTGTISKGTSMATFEPKPFFVIEKHKVSHVKVCSSLISVPKSWTCLVFRPACGEIIWFWSIESDWWF